MGVIMLVGNLALLVALLYSTIRGQLPPRPLCIVYYFVLLLFGIVYISLGFALSGWIALITAAVWGWCFANR